MTLLVGFALLRGAAIGGLSLVSQQVVNLWFVQRRGIAAAAASLELAGGSMRFPKLILLPFAASVDWTGSYAAVLIGCCGLCLVCGAGAFAVKRPLSSAKPITNYEQAS